MSGKIHAPRDIFKDLQILPCMINVYVKFKNLKLQMQNVRHEFYKLLIPHKKFFALVRD